LSDVGEGTKEVQIIQWFVEEGARVEEWAKLCEVQSDKAAVDITSRYSGIIKKLHFKKDDIVQVGDVMVEFEVDGVEEEDGVEAENEEVAADTTLPEQSAEQSAEENVEDFKSSQPEQVEQPPQERKELGKYDSLATPAVRGLLKEYKIAIEDVQGSGKDGRVMKEDVHKYIAQRDSKALQQATAATMPHIDSKQVETPQKLTPIQAAMFKAMTVSLSIPHFLYSDSVNITQLSAMRTRINTARNPETTPKLSYLPFAVKAVSLALNQYPLLNARLDVSSDPKRPQLQMRSSHNIGIAMDTPGGLLVPVIKNVNARSVISIAQEIQRLSQLGQAGKLSNDDLSGGTITVSNIGSIGGEVVGPVIVEGQLAIMGMGKVKAVPIFGQDGKSIERAEVMSVSWSADHRVVDGATMARMAKVVERYLEEPGSMIVDMS
jgi:2-oxoisovalerate dehydrogenase E2 component (dihydrolipoyl transacylase)